MGGTNGPRPCSQLEATLAESPRPFLDGLTSAFGSKFLLCEGEPIWEPEVPHFSEKGREMWEYLSVGFTLQQIPFLLPRPRLPGSKPRMFQPSPRARHLEATGSQKLRLHLSQRTLAAGPPALLQRPPVPPGAAVLMDFLYLTGSGSRLLI